MTDAETTGKALFHGEPRPTTGETAGAATPALEAVARDLIAMAAEDQRSSPLANSEDLAEQLAWRRLTARNGDRLARILADHGWPTSALVGDEASRSAWLIAQHADRQLDLQREALRLMEQAVADGTADRRQLAYLQDRVLVNAGEEQVYGTQIGGVRDGAPVPWPCVDPDRLDERRAEVGIEPFAVHTGRFTA